MGLGCCHPKQIDKNIVEVPQLENPNYEEPINDNSKTNLETNAVIVCSNKSLNEMNYNIKYKPKKRKILIIDI